MTTPKLRFKEFDGCWVEKIISEIADVRGGKRLPKGYSLQEENNGFPYITVTDMENGTVNLEKIRYVPLEAIDQIKRYRISVDEIYISVAGTLGLVGIIPQELNNANLTENADKLTNIKCNQFYLLHYLNNGSLSKLIDSVSTIGAQPKLALYAIQGMPIFLPSLDEQTKIASFLSAVDEKINQLTQKHQLLSQYKQGMMQKLFSQQLRFKADDGSEFGEWENKTLGEVGENIIGLTYSPTDVTNDSTGILVLRSSNIKEGRLDKSDQVRVNKKIKDKIIIQPNDILICTRNGSQRLIGKSVIINDDEIMTFGAFMSVYRSDYNRFIAYLMQTPWFFEQVQMNLGARINQITTGTLNEFTFDFPCLEEQTKIANFLSAIDQKIEVVVQQIEQAKIWKKGLLQQMFV
ncbi:restriction endonuclease subunit S [Acinetobacter indicus]|nr:MULTISPECIES: restriction endonuclease subunit S [Acinetobacter]QOW54166.1 restriction endonuclease subunit S [Acinetobacter indicus]QSQ92330.1 restriction endonuclease subunit S [Acinetobacter indicus]QSQ95010.1 restriction endonuclease subunit S [Acinetobacter indicus]